ncbi:hypothetical protein BH09PSE5_BH09PSE5_20690 [soil metagenome]
MKAHDPLTGLPSRRSFFLALELQATEAQVSGAPLSVLVVDMDGFEAFMDDVDGDAGNRALVTVGKILRLAVGARGVLARLEGDQFGVMFKHGDLEMARARADELRAAIELHFAQQGSALTATVGAACGPHGAGWTGEQLLMLAGQRCKESKLSGVNRVAAAGHPGLPLADVHRWPSSGAAPAASTESLPSPQSRQLSLF